MFGCEMPWLCRDHVGSCSFSLFTVILIFIYIFSLFFFFFFFFDDSCQKSLYLTNLSQNTILALLSVTDLTFCLVDFLLLFILCVFGLLQTSFASCLSLILNSFCFETYFLISVFKTVRFLQKPASAAPCDICVLLHHHCPQHSVLRSLTLSLKVLG